MASSNTRKHSARNGTVPARLSREEWLARALEVLGRKGAGELTVESLARQLGCHERQLLLAFQGSRRLLPATD